MSSIDIESSDVERYNTAVVKESTMHTAKGEGNNKLNTSENFFNKSAF